MNQASTNKYPIKPEPLSVGRLLVHSLVLLIGWALYFWFFYQTFILSNVDAYILIIICILIFMIIIPVVTWIWIKHNLAIYRKKGPRLKTLDSEERYDMDWFKIPIIADKERIKSASEINIDVTEEAKKYIVEKE